jgi:hypothetical protein
MGILVRNIRLGTGYAVVLIQKDYNNKGSLHNLKLPSLVDDPISSFSRSFRKGSWEDRRPRRTLEDTVETGWIEVDGSGRGVGVCKAAIRTKFQKGSGRVKETAGKPQRIHG